MKPISIILTSHIRTKSRTLQILSINAVSYNSGLALFDLPAGEASAAHQISF